jgi:hypothetical protein
MGYQVYRIGKDTGGYRHGGYGVPTYCEHPECNEEIDRGMAFACAGEPFSEIGCDRYFCSKHLQMECFKTDGDEGTCDHEDNCNCECKEVCERCATGKDPFPYKPEHPEWVAHVLTHESWNEWREENPELVEKYKRENEKN